MLTFAIYLTFLFINFILFYLDPTLAHTRGKSMKSKRINDFTMR